MLVFAELCDEDGDGYINLEEFIKTLKIILHYKKYSTKMNSLSETSIKHS